MKFLHNVWLKQYWFLDLSLHILCCAQLPVKIDIIKHPNETDGKSTAIHAKILSPSDVTIYTYPCMPDYEKDKVSFFPYLRIIHELLHLSCNAKAGVYEK